MSDGVNNVCFKKITPPKVLQTFGGVLYVCFNRFFIFSCDRFVISPQSRCKKTSNYYAHENIVFDDSIHRAAAKSLRENK